MDYREIELNFQDAHFKSSLLKYYNWQQIRRSGEAKLEMQTFIKMKQTWKRSYSAAAAAAAAAVAAADDDNDDDDIVNACLWTEKYSYISGRIINYSLQYAKKI